MSKKLIPFQYILLIGFYALLPQLMLAQHAPNGQTTPAATTQALQPIRPAYSSTLEYNTIRTWIPSRPFRHPENVRDTARTIQEVKLENQYIDGLGRPLQVVSKGTSGSGKDVVTPYVHDSMGRMKYEYLSYASTAANGSFKSNPFSEQNTFIKSVFNPSNNANGEKFFYGQINYEATPIGRISKSLPPGNSWAGSNRGTGRSYEINAANEVRIWTISDAEGAAPTSSGFYGAGQLFRNVYTDEEGKMIIEYKDKQENLILKKVQLTSTDRVAHAGWLCTYYVYDMSANLRCVISPRAVELVSATGWSFAANPAYIKDLCFWYWYDARGRLKVKKAPGSGSVKMVYDALDRLVMTQDSSQQSQGVWFINQYDIWNRVVASYLWTNSQTRVVHETAAAASTSYPTLSGTYELLTQSYYDNYTWVAGSGSGLPSTFTTTEASSGFYTASDDTAPYARAITPDYNVKGMLTGTKTKVLGTTSYLFSVIFYDSKGRPLQVQRKNITGGIDRLTTQYSFDGKILVTKENRNATGMTPSNLTLLTTFLYDPVGRLTEIKKKVNSDSTVSVARNTYNELGELQQKKLGQKKTDNTYSADPVETLDYTYNIRGWLTAINRTYIADANAGRTFGMELSYDYGYNVPGSGYFTGNIAGSRWRAVGDGELRSYGFGYDASRRLMKADFTQYTGSWNTSAGIDYSMKTGDGTNVSTAYDANGNILRMDHKGWKPGGSVTIDSLLYTYQDNSNLLKNVIDRRNDTATRLGDFRSSKLYMTALGNVKATSAIDYVYDGNGNMIRDRNKDMGDASNNGISYNYLNLPQTVTFRGTGGTARGTVSFTYDAEGHKLKKTVQETGFSARNTTYLDGLVYINDTLQFVNHEEGRIRYIPAVGSTPAKFQYDYFVKDHLGNTRALLTESILNDAYPQLTLEGTSGTTEVQQQDNYWENRNGQSINVTGSRTARPAAFGTSTTNGSYVILARKSTGAIGATKLLKVMAGDRIHTSVEYFYSVANANNTPANGISSLITSLASSLLAGNAVPSLIKGQASTVTNGLQSNTSLINLLNTAPSSSGANQAPKAYLNVLFFDERFNFDNVNSMVVPVAYLPNQKGTIDKRFANSLLAKKSGYVYLYFSNESDELVYFDNFMLTHERGRLLEESHYYPFGLLMAGISGKSFGIKGNKYLYNGKELQNQEFANGDGAEWYDFGARMLDPQLGRWTTPDPLSEKYFEWSPYHHVANNPLLLVDPEGKDWIITMNQDTKGNIQFDIIFTGVILNSSGKNYDAAQFESTIRAQIERVFNAKIVNQDGTTSSSSIKVNLRTVKSISEIKDEDHIIEIVSPNQNGIFTGANAEAWGRSPIGGLRVYINYNHLNEIMKDKAGDPNTVPHELGHTLGWIHPDQAGDYFGYHAWRWSTSKQKLSLFLQDNEFNLMWSSRKLEEFQVPLNGALSLSSVQLGLMYSNYKAGRINQHTNFGWKWGPWGPEQRLPTLKYPKN
jgi:RHS repeat-associated protein